MFSWNKCIQVYYKRLNIIVTPICQNEVGDSMDQAVNLIFFYLYWFEELGWVLNTRLNSMVLKQIVSIILFQHLCTGMTDYAWTLVNSGTTLYSYISLFPLTNKDTSKMGQQTNVIRYLNSFFYSFFSGIFLLFFKNSLYFNVLF